MRDPDLVLRAQRAAAVLERAWDRWRTLHGRGAQPLPTVSSYVGYSLEEPWGQPRVVFGVPAEDAEQLAALLDRHEWGGPAGVRYPAAAGGQRPDGAPAAQMQRPAAGARPQVPGHAPVGPPERLRAAGPAAADARLADLPGADGMNGHGAPDGKADGVNGHGAPDGHADGVNGHGAPEGHADGVNGHGAPDGHADTVNGHGALRGRADLAGPIERSVLAAQALPFHPAMPVRQAPVTPLVQPADSQLGWAAISGYAPPPAYAEAGSASEAIPGMADEDGQAAQAGLRANGSDAAMTAFRPGAEPVSFLGEKPERSPFADDDQAAGGQAAGGQAARRPRSHRHAAGHAVQHAARQQRASAAAGRDVVPLAKPTVPPQAPGGRRDAQEGRDRGSSAMAGDLAGWASGELPGQARRQPPPPWTVAARPDLDDAEPASGETRRDNAI